jgi:N-acetylmuramoyl-L-alanine amidase
MAKKFKIFIDVGHEGVSGGLDPGAVANGLFEANLNLAIGKRVERLLQQYENVEVKLSRSGDKKLSLDQRTDAADAWGADLLISIHINAGGGVGFESYIYNGEWPTKQATVAMQNVIHNEIMKHCKFFNDRGKKQKNLHMVRESTMKALLTECGFIDNKRDAANLKKDEVLDAIAEGHVEGAAAFLGLKKKVAPKPEVKPAAKEHTWFRVVTGSFQNEKYAEDRVAALKKAGFESFIDVIKQK